MASRKRKADVLGRLDTSDSSGRGVTSGWTTCPLCGTNSSKKYALGRGITSHLHAVHTPWKGGKMELKIKLREFKRRAAEAKRDGKELPPFDATISSWEPSEQEEMDWEQRVVELAAEMEERAKEFGGPGCDRTGKKVMKSYRDSLPELIQAAADGKLITIKSLVQEKAVIDNVEQLRNLLDTKDRNGSIAEHWAAGEGHLECLQYLIKLRKNLPEQSSDRKIDMKVRRREGKTCMHYAARNGRVHIMQFLIDTNTTTIDESSGDGTTPLHLALYGGHLEAAKWLMQNGANPFAKNDWACGSSHWIAMTKCNDGQTKALCNLLFQAGVQFDAAQKQGHFPLHKACQRTNKHVIQWLTQPKTQDGPGFSEEQLKRMGQPDNGGHVPSEIWRSSGGDEDFAKWMETAYGW